MQLVDEIIQMATEGGQPVANLLRKCLVLSYDLKNESLRRWAEQELDGYKDRDDVPEYRRAPVTAKGTFNGPFGASIANQPLPSLIMQEEHRHLAETVRLSQPISAYDIETRQNPIIEWPANLVALYQAKFIEGYALVAAWQEVPASIFVGIVDQVKTRVLKFALEIRQKLKEVADDPKALKKENVQNAVTNNIILGGTNVIAATAHDITQIGTQIVAKDNIVELSSALSSLGLSAAQIDDLKLALEHDGLSSTQTLGQRTTKWLQDATKAGAKGGLKVTVEIAKAFITKWLMQYFGLLG
jgi:hypothetical protein